MTCKTCCILTKQVVKCNLVQPTPHQTTQLQNIILLLVITENLRHSLVKDGHNIYINFGCGLYDMDLFGGSY